MTNSKADHALVSIFCPDREGLVAAVTGRLFDLGINLGDTSFSVLGQGAKFTSVCELPVAISFDDLQSELTSIEMLQDAEISITDFTLEPLHGPAQHMSHRITLSGGDQPGMIACLSELFIGFKANIVRLVSETGGDGGYTIKISAHIPAEATDACLAAVQNTAEGLHLSYQAEAV